VGYFARGAVVPIRSAGKSARLRERGFPPGADAVNATHVDARDLRGANWVLNPVHMAGIA